MLLRVIIGNFLSFNKEEQFDMFPNLKRTTLSEHIYSEGHDVPILKQAAVYGQNGSGKSNLVKAIEFVKAFASDKDFLKSIEIENFFYKLNQNQTGRPISITVEIENDNRYFLYEISIGVDSIEKETLKETFPLKGESSLVFERKKDILKYADGVMVDEVIREATKKLLAKNELSSLVSLNNEFPIFKDNRCQILYQWFKRELQIIGIHSTVPNLINLLHSDKDLLEFSRKLIPKLEVGASDFTLSDEDFENWARHHNYLASTLPDGIEKTDNLSLRANNVPILSITMEKGIRKVYQLFFDMKGQDGFIGHLDASTQSDGTLRALILLPALYSAAVMGKTVVVDEINNCLSPMMVKGLVEFFAKTRDTKGQFIFTTHDNGLLDHKDLLRPDEVWLVDKIEGASTLYTVNDFKEHHTISMMRGYNEGRYGAIRFINLLNENGK